MNSIAQSDNHVPCGYMGMLGCNGYEQIDGIICLIANGDNNFLNEGIVEGSILFIDTKSKFQQGLLNVFKFKSNISPQYKLSRKERLKNLSEAFEVDKTLLTNKPILILDDICTTGSTFEEMIKALKLQGASTITCLATSTPV